MALNVVIELVLKASTTIVLETMFKVCLGFRSLEIESRSSGGGPSGNLRGFVDLRWLSRDLLTPSALQPHPLPKKPKRKTKKRIRQSSSSWGHTTGRMRGYYPSLDEMS